MRLVASLISLLISLPAGAYFCAVPSVDDMYSKSALVIHGTISAIENHPVSEAALRDLDQKRPELYLSSRALKLTVQVIEQLNGASGERVELLVSNYAVMCGLLLEPGEYLLFANEESMVRLALDTDALVKRQAPCQAAFNSRLKVNRP